MELQPVIERAMVSLSGDVASASAQFRFAPDEFFFKGHFPSGPVLPAVVQLGAVVALASRLIGAPQRLCEVTRSKFTNPTGPGRLLGVAIEIEAAGSGRHKVRAAWSDGETPVSEFALRVEPTGE